MTQAAARVGVALVVSCAAIAAQAQGTNDAWFYNSTGTTRSTLANAPATVGALAPINLNTWSGTEASFAATSGGLGLGCFFHLAAEGCGNVSEFRFVGKRLEEPLAQDVIDLVGGEVNRRKVALRATKFLARIVERPSDQGASTLICCVQIRDHHTDIGLLARCGE